MSIEVQATPVVAGAAVGAGAGLLAAGKTKAGVAAKEAAITYGYASDSFVKGRLTRNERGDIKHGIHDKIKGLETKVSKLRKANTELAKNADGAEALKKGEEKLAKTELKLRTKSHKAASHFVSEKGGASKELKTRVANLRKQFDVADNGVLKEAMNTTSQAFKKTRIKWVAHVAAAGAALGILAGVVYNKIKADKAE